MELWKESMTLALMVYKLTENFPKTELYGLVSQIRRCSVSIPSNIAEGSVRSSNKETAHFIDISLGSLAELDTQLLLSKELGFYNGEQIFEQLKKVNALLKEVPSIVTTTKQLPPEGRELPVVQVKSTLDVPMLYLNPLGAF